MASEIDPITQLPKADPRLKPLTEGHHGHECRHLDDMDWEVQRFGGIRSKMLFHPHPDRPTEPNAGVLRYAPGGGHPLHSHYFAQVWYILSGEFDIGGQIYGPGTMVFHPDPHFEVELKTETGGDILFVQYQGRRRARGLSMTAASTWMSTRTWIRSAWTTRRPCSPASGPFARPNA